MPLSEAESLLFFKRTTRFSDVRFGVFAHPLDVQRLANQPGIQLGGTGDESALRFGVIIRPPDDVPQIGRRPLALRPFAAIPFFSDGDHVTWWGGDRRLKVGVDTSLRHGKATVILDRSSAVEFLLVLLGT